MLEKEPGVFAALPFCDKKHVEVWANRDSALTEEAAKKIIELDKEFEVTGFQRR